MVVPRRRSYDVPMASEGGQLDGKVVLVSGGASDIGRATALRLAGAGAAVVVGDVSPDGAGSVAEVVEAFRKEFAVTLGDALLRRVPVALGACWSESCSREAALRVGAVLGWDEQTLGANLESFETERTAFLQRPSRGTRTLEAAAD